MTIVELTLEELKEAACVAVERRYDSRKRSLGHAHGYKDADFWTTEIESSASEYAVCKLTGIRWNRGVGTFHLPDAGEAQVRWTRYSTGKLIVRSIDKDSDFFILAIGEAPRYRIAGYIRGADAKKHQWSESPNGRPPAYFVPQSALLPAQELAEVVRAKNDLT